MHMTAPVFSMVDHSSMNEVEVYIDNPTGELELGTTIDITALGKKIATSVLA